MRVFLIAFACLISLSAFSCSMPGEVTNQMCKQHADATSCAADTANSCHWNLKETACKG